MIGTVRDCVRVCVLAAVLLGPVAVGALVTLHCTRQIDLTPVPEYVAATFCDCCAAVNVAPAHAGGAALALVGLILLRLLRRRPAAPPPVGPESPTPSSVMRDDLLQVLSEPSGWMYHRYTDGEAVTRGELLFTNRAAFDANGAALVAGTRVDDLLSEADREMVRLAAVKVIDAAKKVDQDGRRQTARNVLRRQGCPNGRSV